MPDLPNYFEERALYNEGAALLRDLRFMCAPRERVAADTLYFGVELELESVGEYTATDLILTAKEVNQDRLWGWKTDGSLTRGIELVTMPMTFKYFNTKFPWQMFDKLSGQGESFNRSGNYNAGVHIHMSQKAFTKDHLFRFMKFHYGNKPIVTKVGGRDTTMGKFTVQSYTGATGTPTDEVLQQFAATGNSGYDRYTCVNLNHGGGKQTAELRYFRSTSNPLRFRGYVEWAHAVYSYTKKADNALTGEGIADYIGQQAEKYPNALAILEGQESHMSKKSRNRAHTLNSWERANGW